MRGLRKEFGPLFGLVNNAALGIDGALAMMHNSKIEEMVRVNTLAPIVLTKYVVRGDDGGRRRPHRQRRLDHRLHRLQRACRPTPRPRRR